MKTRENKKMIKLDLFFKIAILDHMLKKSAHSFFGA